MNKGQPVRKQLATSVPTVYYPIFLNLSGKKAVVIGGGKVAERKIPPLIKARAQVTVISPKITRKIEQMKGHGKLNHVPRSYRRGDLREAFLVIAATASPSVNERVSRDARCLVNVVDTPHLCNFIVPSTMVRGPLNIAISTGGISPAFARSIRKELEKKYGCEFARYLRSLKKMRQDAIKMVHDRRKRTAFLKRIASGAAIRKVRKQGSNEMKRIAAGLLEKAKDP